MTLIIDSTKLFKQPSTAYNRNHNFKKKIYLYKEMNSDSWAKFTEHLDHSVSCDQVLDKLHSLSNITSKKHLNCL